MARQGQGTAVTTLKAARQWLQQDNVKEQIAMAAVSSIDVDRLIKTALSVMSTTPRLLECTPASWALALQQAAEVGLEPTGTLGYAHLIPRRNRNGQWEAHFQVSARGRVELVRRSGVIRDVEAHVVRDGDTFDYRLGADPALYHKPLFTAGGDREVVAAYAVAHFHDGSKRFEVMSRAEIEEVRSLSRAANDGPWVDHFSEMARKTVVNRICKNLPMKTETARALATVERANIEAQATSPATLSSLPSSFDPDADAEPDYDDHIEYDVGLEEDPGASAPLDEPQPGLEF